MRARFTPFTLQGSVAAPPSKSMAHRYLIGAALSGQRCRLSGISGSEDMLATVDCLRALGAEVTWEGDAATVEPGHFMQVEGATLPCRESGSTLRFFLPLALCLGREVTLRGSSRLLSRPLGEYETLCREEGFLFRPGEDSITVCGRLRGGSYRMRGDVSSQFITGLMLALVYLGKRSSIEILPPFASRPYVELTVAALTSFGARVLLSGNRIEIEPATLHAFSGRIEGDYSNAAFLDAFNHLGSSVTVEGLLATSLQGDRVYAEYFRRIAEGTPTLDLSDCPDLGPVLFALAALKNGAVFVGTDRLAAKESDRGAAMHEELAKLGGGLLFGENTITVPKQELRDMGRVLSGHNDHRIVMALSLVLSRTGGVLDGTEAVRKSYPGFFEDIGRLGARVEWI